MEATTETPASLMEASMQAEAPELEILPLGERVLVEILEVASPGGLVIPTSESNHAIVVAVGPDVDDRVSPGDVVFLPRGDKLGDHIGGYLLLPVNHIAAIVREKRPAAGVTPIGV